MTAAEMIAALSRVAPDAKVFVNYDGEFCSEVRLEAPEMAELKNVVLLSLEGDASWELPIEEEEEEGA